MAEPISSSGDRDQGDARARIVKAAARLIAAGGADAATTRAVAEAASVQAPTIYRLFSDKRGLLDAVAEQCFADHVATKAQAEIASDPLEDLRQGWNDHVAFGLANPAIYALMSTSDPSHRSRASEAGLDILRAKVRRLALSGRLRVSEEQAVDLMRAGGTGTVLVLLQMDPKQRERLNADAREAIFAVIADADAKQGDAGPAGTASALRADLDNVAALSPGERLLLDELLQRIAQAG